MNKTSIEWVKNPDGTQGYTWNPITGCLNHIDGMCKGGGFPCYAYKLANGRLRGRYLSANTATAGPKAYLASRGDPFYPRFWEDRLGDLPHARTFRGFTFEPDRNGIFVCDMSDLFGIGIPDDWTKQVLAVIEAYPEHRFYLLTKQPQNLIKFSPFPENCWVGVTATDEISLWSASYWLGMKGTISLEAKVKFISFEPLLKSIDGGYDFPPMTKEEYLEAILRSVDWVIIGAQTKPTVYPRIEWVEEIVTACDKAGVAVFLKDNLKPILPPFGNELFPPAIRVRQELPSCNK